MPEKEKKTPEKEDKAKETEPEKEKEGAENSAENPETEKPQSDDKQADENGEGAPEKSSDAVEKEKPAAEDEKPAEPANDEEKKPPVDEPASEPTAPEIPPEQEAPAADNSAMELLDAKAQLAAFKSGVRADVVEDAVCLAIHDAQKTGTVDADSVAEALKSVLDRHPEWKNSSENNSAGFRVGADGTKENTSSGDEISKIFGNK